MRIFSIISGGSLVMLAKVRFLTLPPSRYEWRIRIVGDDLRFGTTSMNMLTRLS